jgi:sulfite exporter TauE/SafE
MGALTMFCFGLGTLTGILAAGVIARQNSTYDQHKHFRQVAGVLLMFYGSWTIFVSW